MQFSTSKSKQRLIIAITSCILSLLFIFSLHMILQQNSDAARLLLDYRSDNNLYPFTVQNLMWLVFFLGLGELWARFNDGRIDRYQLHQAYLPEDERTLLQASDLGSIYQKIRNNTMLEMLIFKILVYYQN